MADISQVPNSITRVALAASPKAVHALAPAIGLLGLAILFSDRFAGFVFLLSGATLFFLVGILALLKYRFQHSKGAVWRTAKSLCENDAAACFGVDSDGLIVFRNPAASQRFPNQNLVFSSVIADLFASSQSVVHRLIQKTDETGSASENIAAAGNALRISVHQVDDVGYFWRVEERISPGGAAAVDVPLPMMRVSKPHTILDMNDAMHKFLGSHPKSLDRVAANLPLQTTEPTAFQTAKGSVEVNLAIVDETDQIQQVFVWPETSPVAERASADSIPVPMMRISATGRIVMANARAQKLLALKDDAEMDFAQVIEGHGRPVNEWLLDITEGRGSGRTEVVRAALPEQDVYLQVSLGRMVDRGEVSVLAVLIDATELKTLEAQFVQSQKMQAIGQLAGGVAHDFNNLLTAISGHCDLLLLRHEPGHPNYGDLVQINQNANRAASLVGQLLAFSRKQNMQPEMIDLRDTLGDLTHLLNRLVGEKIDLRWTHDPELPRVRADKRQLEQVLMNLVVNARDAMQNGGTIEIKTTAVHLAETMVRDRAEVPAGEYVVVKVCDQGCGISPDKLQKIFEPFYSTKKTGEGTGLGLSMAYGIVKQSGGFIFVNSTPDNGSTFTMYFPAHNKADIAPPKILSSQTATAPKQEGGHVLLVEDEAPVRAFASRALRLRGYTVTEADCAEAALELLESPDLHFDVFVTDVVMPGLDGPTWVAQALKTRPGVKVVFVSGYAEDSVTHSRTKIPNSTFLPKPFSLSQLTETVQAQME